MRCERAQELFSDYIEDGVSRALRVPFESHLEKCDDCRARLSELRSLWHVLDTAPVAEPPDNFRAVVWQRIEEAERTRASESPLRRLLGGLRLPTQRPALAGLAAAAVVIVLMVTTTPGRNVAANLGLPWTTRSTAAPATFTAGVPAVSVTNGATRVTIPLRSDRAVEASVTTDTPHTRVVGDASRMRIVPGTPASITVEVDAGAAPSAVALTVRPVEPATSPRTLTVELPELR